LALQAKPHIADIQPVTHGGINFCAPAKHGANSKSILDFSTCCNPYGPPASVQGALTRADVAVYPDPDCREFIGLLSRSIGAARENLIATSGSTELLRLAALAYTGPGDTAVIPSPTYGEYELACRIAGARIVKYQMKEDTGFRLAANDFISFARKSKPSAIFLCNPNNPTGQFLSFSDIGKIVPSFPDTLIVLDEAYLSFTADAWDSLQLLHHPNVLLVRSLTKDFALAGLRLGYGIASREIISTLKKLRPPWNVNCAAQQAGIAALSNAGHMKKCGALINKGKDYLVAELESLGYAVLPTDANFFLVRVGKAADFQSRLLDRGFLVRDCSSFGLPGYVRMAPRRMQDCRSLIAAIKSVQSEVE